MVFLALLLWNIKMKALISPNEKVRLPDGSIGERVAQVEPDDRIFIVAEPLFWTDCADNVVADYFYWDGTEILPIPPAPPAPEVTKEQLLAQLQELQAQIINLSV